MGGALANRLGCGFVPIRKSGKLPGATISQDYQLEYGSDTLEVHVDSIEPGEGWKTESKTCSIRQFGQKSGGVSNIRAERIPCGGPPSHDGGGAS